MVWIAGLVMLLAAGLFVAWPLRRSAQSVRTAAAPAAEDAAATARALYRDRVAEIEAEVAAGRLDPAVRQQVLDELASTLLDDHRALAAAVPDAAPTSARGWTGWLLAGLLPLAGLGVYWTVGEPTADTVVGAAAVLHLDPETDRPAIEDWQKRLERRLAARPDDAQSLYLLGTIHLQLGEFEPAASVFAKASDLVGPDPVIDVYWLQARYMAAGGQLDAAAQQIAQRILERNPSHPLVLELMAIDAFRTADYRAAAGYLNRVLMNELEPERVEALLQGLAAARAQLTDLLPSVEVAIASPAGAPPGGVVFVVARPPGGGMPHAVVRRPANLLPLAVTLDDLASLNPDAPLSAAGSFEVVVRLSQSGSPMAQPGDWSWQSGVLTEAELAAPLRFEAVLAPPSVDGASSEHVPEKLPSPGT